jgi:hypothetical protein
LRVTRNSLNSDADDDLLDIDELLLGIKQKNILASTNLNPNDDGFLDIDELLLGIQQKTISASAKPDSGGIAGELDGRTQGGSPADSSCSTEGSIQGEHTELLNLARTSYLYDPRSDYTE